MLWVLNCWIKDFWRIVSSFLSWVCPWISTPCWKLDHETKGICLGVWGLPDESVVLWLVILSTVIALLFILNDRYFNWIILCYNIMCRKWLRQEDLYMAMTSSVTIYYKYVFSTWNDCLLIGNASDPERQWKWLIFC